LYERLRKCLAREKDLVGSTGPSEQKEFWKLEDFEKSDQSG